MIYDSRDQLFVISTIDTAAANTAGFVSTGAASSGQMYGIDGVKYSTSGADTSSVKISYKNSLGVADSTPAIVPSKIIAYKQTSPVTAVPAYASFTIDNTNLEAGDTVEVFARVYGMGSGSSQDQNESLVGYTMVSGDTSTTIANGVAELLIGAFASKYRVSGKQVYNLAGYTKIYSTEAEVITNKADLTDDSLIWVIANEAAYTVTDKTATTFATICTAKTDWSTEITAGTAEYLSKVKNYDFVQVNDTDIKLYCVAKATEQSDERFSGRSSITSFDATTKDSSGDTIETVASTHVFEIVNPGAGKLLRNKEVSLDFNQRPYGKFELAGEDPQLEIDVTKDYYVLDLDFNVQDLNTNNNLVKTNGRFHTTICSETEATITAFITALDAITA